jgi:hypothetical protein
MMVTAFGPIRLVLVTLEYKKILNVGGSKADTELPEFNGSTLVTFRNISEGKKVAQPGYFATFRNISLLLIRAQEFAMSINGAQ